MPRIQDIDQQLDSGQGADDGAHWRDQVLVQILRIVFVLGAITAVPSIVFAIEQNLILVAVVDCVAMLWVGIAALRPTLPYALRAWSLVILAHVLGLVFLIWVGSASQIYLMAVPVLAALFLGIRAGGATLVSSSLTLLLVGYFTEAEIHIVTLEQAPLAKWILISLNFAFVSGVLMASTAILLARLERTLQNQQAISASLEENAARLVSANADLASEVESRRRAQEQTARLARAIEQGRDGILITDNEGRIVYANGACADFYDRAASDLTGRTVAEVWPASDPRAPIARAIGEGRSCDTSVTRENPAGQAREIEAVVGPLREDDGRLLHHVVLLRDVSRERHLEARLRQSEKLEAVGTLAGGVAHDFNNIIGSILAVAESIRDEALGVTPGDAVGQIIIACHRARDIVRQMMHFSRRSMHERRAVSASNLIEEALPLLRAALPSNVGIHCDLDSRALVMADPAEIQQVLMNLSTNAAHAMEAKGGGDLLLSVTSFAPDEYFVSTHPGLEAQAPYVRLLVRDSGDGIASEHLPRIFEPFYTTKAPGSGTGLGLASVHGIVASLDGAIDVYTELGRGTSFQIYLPAVEGAPDERPASPPPVRAASVACGRILLVDDEEQIRRVSERFLLRSGYQVTSASDGDTARLVLESDPAAFDLIVTDLTMPGISGADLIRLAHRLRPTLPTILTSGFGDTMNPEERESLSPSAFIQKPYTQAQLADLVQNLLRSPADDIPQTP